MKGYVALSGVLALLATCSASAAWQTRFTSPDKQLSASLSLDEQGRLWYQLFHHNQPVLKPSPLGLNLNNAQFAKGLSFKKEAGQKTVQGQYELWTGKQRHVEYQANDINVSFTNPLGHTLTIEMRLSDDGLAYRYVLPEKSTDSRIVMNELTGFHFFPETKAWLQHKADAKSGWERTNPSYEEDYSQNISVETPSPTENGWIYPALYHYGNDWIAITEAGNDGHYAGSNLAQKSPDGLYQLRFPSEKEGLSNGKWLPEAKLPLHSPWRIIAVGDLNTLMSSTLGSDLAEPAKITDTAWIKPGISAWSWGLLKDESVTYPIQKEFIDYAAKMHWPYILIDVNWDQNIGYDKMAELAQYAKGKNVGLLVWYNSSGAWNGTQYTPKSQLLTHDDREREFARLQQMGIKGVKVDFFPGDGSSVMQYYQDILKDAAEHQLMVNFHGTTLPRGLQRTWPNLLTAEAVKGFEMITFFQEVADREATHIAMLPFTRNLFDPMDFTPMVLGDIPNIERKTSNGFELALPVLLTSGIQHLVTTPKQMESMPEFVKRYLRSVPGRWDESRFLGGYPGKYAVIARRAGKQWFIAGINAEKEPKTLELDLSFVGKGQGLLIEDGASPRALVQSEVDSGVRQLTLKPSAGFVMVFN
ncbi:alpha-glucosidase [Shewanella mangrovi]|uniref:Alpha-glucosidase n=1 Tax=Shewanella mangrovi TaxID=1515746 RepID=A0A094JLP9_9GAMM|nr:glycoside hydrolase family 97 protein [Shewanella mangrovi]KFZ38984.1 alpha-glucosidase [Shewanella mangrovi]